MTGWSTGQEIMGHWVDAKDIVVGLSQRTLEALRQLLASVSPERREATVWKALLLAGKLHYAAYAVRPGRYFVRRRLWLANLHLTEEESRSGGDAWGRRRKKWRRRGN